MLLDQVVVVDRAGEEQAAVAAPGELPGHVGAQLLGAEIVPGAAAGRGGHAVCLLIE
jgi:hypothetical protein